MPIGGFLDSFPASLFIAAHVLFIIVGFWALSRARQARLRFAPAFWLYIITQLGFLAFFGNAVTLKMAVLFEQTLILIMVIWIVRRPSAS